MINLQRNFLDIVVSPTGYCNRFCRHCFAKSKKDHIHLTFFDAFKLARELDTLDCPCRVQLTGGGEPLCLPLFEEFTDALFSSSRLVELCIITSGVLPGCEEEEAKLRALLEKPYKDKLTFDLSYNLYNPTFPKRLPHTLQLLFEHGIRYAIIKMTAGELNFFKTYGTLISILKNLCMGWLRDVQPLALEENVGSWLLFSPLPKLISNPKLQRMLGQVPTQERYDLLWALTYQQQFVFSIDTEWGQRTIGIQPQSLSKIGRAAKLPDIPYVKNSSLCGFLKGTPRGCDIQLHADGYYYPGSCNICVQEIRLGQLYGTSLLEVLKNAQTFRQLILRHFLADQRQTTDSCSRCKNIASEIWDPRQ